MIDTLIQKRFFPVMLFLFAFGLFAVNIWGTSIYILDEAKNTECAREMFEEGNFFKPTFNFNLRKDKPPLHYFFMMLSYSIFGVTEFAARFFSAVFGALTILITFIYTSRFLNRKMAFWASTVLLSSIHLAIQFHLAVPDPYLIFFFCWSLFLFYSAIKTNKLGDKILLYISIGLATLTKGPMAIALPGLIFLLFLIFSKQFNWKTIKKLQPFMGLVIVAAIALPWFIINGIETNWEWTKGFFIHHNIDRFSSKMEGHGGIFLLTFVFVILGMFPFSAFLIQAIGLSVKKRENKFLLFNLIAASTIILFFSISKTKLPNYTVPAYPFLAIILAYYIDNFKKIKSLKPSFIFILILALTVFIGGFWGLNIDTSLASASSKIWWFMVLPIGVFISILFIIKRKTEQSFLTLTLTGIITSLVFFMFVYPAVDNLNPVKKSLHLLKGKEVAYYKKFNASYSFYLKKKIPELTETEFDIFFSEHHDGIIISIQKQIDQIKLPQNCEVIFSGKDIMEIPTTVLISKKK